MIYSLIKKHIPSARLVADGNEILIRCRYCPDSDNPNHAHMYISNNSNMEYYCQKCGASGILTKRKLINWGIIDYDIMKILKNNYSGSDKYKQSSSYIANIINPEPFNKDLAQKKIDYINNRLGLRLTESELVSNKVVLNLYDLLSYNNLKNTTQKDYILKKLHNEYIGFLSYDNLSVNMRNIVSNNYRYSNYKINNNKENDSSMNFYIIPSLIDISKLTRIHISEGPFDILSIKYNVVKPNELYNDLFIAVKGISYQTVISYINSNIGIINPIFEIYLDNGINQSVTNKIYNILKNVPCELYLHRNVYDNEKDFGVPKSRIIDNIEKVN